MTSGDSRRIRRLQRRDTTVTEAGELRMPSGATDRDRLSRTLQLAISPAAAAAAAADDDDDETGDDADVDDDDACCYCCPTERAHRFD